MKRGSILEQLQDALIEKIRDVPATDLDTIRAYIQEIKALPVLFREDVIQETEVERERNSGLIPPEREPSVSMGLDVGVAAPIEPLLQEADLPQRAMEGEDATPLPSEPDDYSVFGSPPNIPPAYERRPKKPRELRPCPDCGKMMPGQGFENHRRSAHPEPIPQPEPAPEPLRSPPVPDPEPSLVCPDCGVEKESQAILTSHRHFAHPDPGETPTHRHRWKMDPPVGGIVKGVCSCGDTREDPADLSGHFRYGNGLRCPRCGGRASKDVHGAWCNVCNIPVLEPEQTSPAIS